MTFFSSQAFLRFMGSFDCRPQRSRGCQTNSCLGQVRRAVEVIGQFVDAAARLALEPDDQKCRAAHNCWPASGMASEATERKATA